MERIKRQAKFCAAVLCTAALLGTAAPATQASVTAGQAKSAVQKILNTNKSACHLKKRGHIKAKAIAAGWRVSVRVTTFGNLGTAKWTVSDTGQATAAEPLAADIGVGCPG